jgi:hypothetical protein
MSDYAIVIPAVQPYAKCTNAKQLIQTLLTSISWGHYDCPVVICWDNASPAYIKDIEREFPFITSISHIGPKNLNFAKNSNRGLRYVHQELGKSAFLVNMDTALPNKGFLQTIINEGISSPRAHHIKGTPQQKTFNLNKMATPGCPCNKGQNMDKATPVTRFAGFCMYVSKIAMDKIGYLDDETFVASFEDDDICVRACLAGLPCEMFEIPVHHELEGRDQGQISTTGSYDLQQLAGHIERFRSKWKIPGGVGHGEFADWILKNYTWDDKWKCN